VLADSLVALTRAFPQPVQVCDLDSATGGLQKPSLLKRMRDRGHAGTAHTQHLGQKFLREGKTIALREVAGPQKPAGKPLFNGVHDVARRTLLRLRIDNLFMADQERLQRGALHGRPF
jgi:hypothetical protein